MCLILLPAEIRACPLTNTYCVSVQMCSTGYGKVHLESNLARGVKDNKKGFFKSIRSKRNTRENVRLLLNGMGAVMMKDTEYVGLLNVLFASVFAAEACSQESQTKKAREKVWSKEDFPLVEQDWFRDHLGNCDTCKSRDPNGDAPTRAEGVTRCCC